MIHTRESRPGSRWAALVVLAAAIAACLAACHSPQQSQKYFATEAAQDPMLELLHETALYSVYFDHALRRCVLHSTYTWGENGGGGGGTGIGVSVFPCDPARLRERAEDVEASVSRGVRLELPRTQPVQEPTPASAKTNPAPAPVPVTPYP